MLPQHLLHSTLICIISDKAMHNDSQYTDIPFSTYYETQAAMKIIKDDADLYN